jgi:hypothetical protein
MAAQIAGVVGVSRWRTLSLKWEMFVASRLGGFLWGIRAGKNQGSKLWDAGAFGLRAESGRGRPLLMFDDGSGKCL